MIPYTLAKELKDNGFGIKNAIFGVLSSGLSVMWDNEYGWCANEDADYKESDFKSVIEIPLLEEVIEALGKKRKYYLPEDFNLTLAGSDDGWDIGYTDNNYGEILEDITGGPTPLIAACNLWLAVNRK